MSEKDARQTEVEVPAHPAERRLMWARRVMLLALSCGLALLVCELIARMVFLAPPYPYREPSLAYIRHPQLIYFHKVKQVGWIDDGKASINSLGLRGAEPAIPKPAGMFRILAIGDSLTFGWGVNDAETFCALVEAGLNRGQPAQRVDVVNGGVSGYTTRQERTLLSIFGPKLQPDLVLVGFYWNDLLMSTHFGRDGREGDTDVRFETASSEPLTRRELHMTGSGSWPDRLLRCSRAAYVGGRGVKRLAGLGEWNRPYTSLEDALLAGRTSKEIEQRWTRFESEMQRIKKLAREVGSRTGIVVLPSRQQVGSEFPHAEIQSKVREIARRLEMFVVDPLPNLRARRDEVESLFIPYDRHHPSALGHRIIAEAILAELVSLDRLHSGE
jgi:lysophospholipase L1-like esterase